MCIEKVYWTKSNFPSKYDFKSDEDKKKTLARSLWRNCQILPHFACIYVGSLGDIETVIKPLKKSKNNGNKFSWVF